MLVTNKPCSSPPKPSPTASAEVDQFLDLLARLIARWHVRHHAAGDDPECCGAVSTRRRRSGRRKPKRT